MVETKSWKFGFSFEINNKFQLCTGDTSQTNKVLKALLSNAETNKLLSYFPDYPVIYNVIINNDLQECLKNNPF